MEQDRAELEARLAELERKNAELVTQVHRLDLENKAAGAAAAVATADVVGDNDEELDDPDFDATDSCFRCSRCGAEVVQYLDDGKSANSDASQSDVDVDEASPESDDRAWLDRNRDSQEGENGDQPAEVQGRALANAQCSNCDARCRIPETFFDDPIHDTIPFGTFRYKHRFADDDERKALSPEHRKLIELGASPWLIETYKLSYSKEEGIRATLPDDIMRLFPSPDIHPRDARWEVLLGHEITIDPTEYRDAKSLSDERLVNRCVLDFLDENYLNTHRRNGYTFITFDMTNRPSWQSGYDGDRDAESQVRFHDDYTPVCVDSDEEDMDAEELAWFNDKEGSDGEPIESDLEEESSESEETTDETDHRGSSDSSGESEDSREAEEEAGENLVKEENVAMEL